MNTNNFDAHNNQLKYDNSSRRIIDVSERHFRWWHLDEKAMAEIVKRNKEIDALMIKVAW